jgi:hypothetical protein
VGVGKGARAEDKASKVKAGERGRVGAARTHAPKQRERDDEEDAII